MEVIRAYQATGTAEIRLGGLFFFPRDDGSLLYLRASQGCLDLVENRAPKLALDHVLDREAAMLIKGPALVPDPVSEKPLYSF